MLFPKEQIKDLLRLNIILSYNLLVTSRISDNSRKLFSFFFPFNKHSRQEIDFTVAKMLEQSVV